MKKRILNFFYNEDRAVASLDGAPPQETISSEIGRHRFNNPIANLAYKILDKIQPGHCEIAVKHADALDAADNGFEQ